MLPNSWNCSYEKKNRFFSQIWDERFYVCYAEKNHRERNPYCQNKSLGDFSALCHIIIQLTHTLSYQKGEKYMYTTYYNLPISKKILK